MICMILETTLKQIKLDPAMANFKFKSGVCNLGEIILMSVALTFQDLKSFENRQAVVIITYVN